jgi:DNA repair protein RadD
VNVDRNLAVTLAGGLMNAPTPRWFQTDLETRIQEAWDEGARNVIGVLPTGGGKTFVFSKILQEHNGPSLAIAHRQELVGQISLALARNGVRHRLVAPHGVVSECCRASIRETRRNYIDPTARCAVAGVDTLIRIDPKTPWLHAVTLWVCDECFPAGTLVDGKPIEAIRVGDMVTAFNEVSGLFERRRVMRTFRNPAPEDMVKLLTTEHHVLYCTLGHPFWTQRGWVNAGKLTTQDEVLVYDLHELRGDDIGNKRSTALPLPEDGPDILHQDVRNGAPRVAQDSRMDTETKHAPDDRRMYDLPGAGRLERAPESAIPENGASLLWREMLPEVPGDAIFGGHDKNESAVRIIKNDRAQPDAARRRAIESERGTQGEGSHAEGPGREWPTTKPTGASAHRPFRPVGIHSSVINPDESQEGRYEKAPGLLQTGHRERRAEDRGRGRWGEPQVNTRPGTGCEKRRVSHWARLDRVEIYKRNDPRIPGSGNDDGHVYNIEVDSLHTYIANGIVVHNCHHLLAGNKWGRAVSMLPAARGLGVTATPCRADGRGLGRHADGVMDALIVGPGMRELIREGWLSEYRIFAAPSDLDLSRVNIGANGDYSPDPLRKAVHASHIVGDAVQHYLRIAAGKLGITFSVDVEAATEQAAAYRAAGIPAEVVSAKTPDYDRREILRRLRSREILQVCNVDLFGEGFDLPAIEVVSMTRPTESYALFAQQFGRGLRIMDGKTHAIIIDHVDNTMRHGLPDAPRVWTLDRRERRSRGSTGVSPVRVCLGCAGVYDRALRACPYCGTVWTPADRSAPEFVDGDLAELSPEVLARLRGEIDKPLVLPYHAPPEVIGAVKKHHREKQEAQSDLRSAMAAWGGRHTQRTDAEAVSEMQRRFWLTFGINVLTAQTLGRRDAVELMERIQTS